MTYNPNPLFSAEVTQPTQLRYAPGPDGLQVKTIAAVSGAPELGVLYPLSFNDSTGFFDPWASAVSAVWTITADGTPASAGTFILNVNGEDTATIAFDADAAAVVAAIEALGDFEVGDVSGADTVATDLGDANHVVTLTFGGSFKGKDVNIVADYTAISAGNDPVEAQATAGSGYDTGSIDAFVAPNPAQTSATEEIMSQCLMNGLVHRDDVVLPAGEAQGDLDAALKTGLRAKGYTIQGLAGVH